MAVAQCGSVTTIDQVWVEGDRDDGHEHANTVLVKMASGGCQGMDYLFIRESDNGYHSILSTVLTAKASDLPVRFYVNKHVKTATAVQISIVVLD